MSQGEAKKKETGMTQKQVGLAGVVIAVVLIIVMAIFIRIGPLKKYRQSQAGLRDLQSQLSVLKSAKEEELARLEKQKILMDRLQQRKPNFDLWSFVNSTLAETQLKDRAILEQAKATGRRSEKKYNAESVTLVRLRLTAVPLNDLVEFLHRIYASNNLVVIYELKHIKPASDGKGLDCEVTLLSPKPYASDGA